MKLLILTQNGISFPSHQQLPLSTYNFRLICALLPHTFRSCRRAHIGFGMLFEGLRWLGRKLSAAGKLATFSAAKNFANFAPERRESAKCSFRFEWSSLRMPPRVDLCIITVSSDPGSSASRIPLGRQKFFGTAAVFHGLGTALRSGWVICSFVCMTH